MFFQLFDPLYWLLIGPTILLSLWAQFKVKGTYGRYSEVETRRRITGAQLARLMLQSGGIQDVKVEEVDGFLSDHYSPKEKVLRLSPTNFRSGSIAALGVSAHETGHAFQHAQGYLPLKARSILAMPTMVVSNLGMIMIMVSFFLLSSAPVLGKGVAILGLAFFGMSAVFALVTLPVEFDASRRALKMLEGGGVLQADEMDGARKVLNAAALTYVAAAIAAIMNLIYWAIKLGLLGSRRDE